MPHPHFHGHHHGHMRSHLYGAGYGPYGYMPFYAGYYPVGGPRPRMGALAAASLAATQSTQQQMAQQQMFLVYGLLAILAVAFIVWTMRRQQ